MPKKDKTSFFGKIMGGSVTEDTMPEVQAPVSAQDPEEEEMVLEAEELAPEDSSDTDQELVIETEEVYEQIPAQAQAQTPIEAAPIPEKHMPQTQQQPVAKDNANEDWLNDFEGQLNIDMYQTKDNVIIKSTIAGVRPDDIDITVANDMVTVKGARKKIENISADDYFYQECYWGNFSRSVIIPVDIDSENIEADLKDGILTVVIPKAAKAKTKKVKVKGL